MDTILSKALREFTTGQLNQLIVNLGGQDGSQWENELKRFLRKESCWVNGEVAKAPNPKTRPNFLELVSTVVIPATTTKFVAKKRFVINTKQNAPVKISDLGDNFTAWFLRGNGKIEDPISEQTLLCHKLLKSSSDDLIIEKLSGEAKAETTLSEMFSLMEKHGKGENGVFLNNNDYAKIFYIKDNNGVLRVVRLRWCGDGWGVFASSVDDQCRWRNGRQQVFSRNSVLESSEPSTPAQT